MVRGTIFLLAAVSAALAALAGSVAWTGCLGSDVRRCGFGVVCPPGLVCSETHERCVFPIQVEACRQKEDGDACDYSGTPDGRCYGDVCFPRGCGNGFVDVDEGEACDDGNTESEDGCSADCSSNETCGNGVLDLHMREQCDDGNLKSHDGCSSGCTAEHPTWTRWIADFPGVFDSAMVYDTARQRFVMFGGSDGYMVNADTWVFEGGSWAKLAPANSPAARDRHAMVYDPARDRIVLVGGVGAEEYNDTWEFDGVDWQEIHTPAAPPAREVHAVALDSVSGNVVLFGGVGSGHGRTGTRGTGDAGGKEWGGRSVGIVETEQQNFRLRKSNGHNMSMWSFRKPTMGGDFSPINRQAETPISSQKETVHGRIPSGYKPHRRW